MKKPGPWRRWFAWYPVEDHWHNIRWWVWLERRWNPAVGERGGWQYRAPE